MALELRVRCLGRLSLHCQGAPELAARELPLPATLKAQSLLAYLIIHRDRPHSRDHLAEQFWGDRPEHNARHSLATALWQIRRCLPAGDFILADSAGVQLDPQSLFWLDVAEFESLLRASSTPALAPKTAHHVPGTSVLQQAVELYRGAFLDGFYDDWVLSERYRLESLYCEALAGLMAARATLGEHAASLAAALRLLEQDPLREDAHRAAMTAYCRLGQRHAALAQYARCQQTLQAELGVEPMVETLALRQAILDGSLACATGTTVAIQEAPQRRDGARHPLDAAGQIPLVGREQELAFLADSWEAVTSSDRRLVLISGEAGVGKTRLVQAFADLQRWQGRRVLRGYCYEFERLLPYQPVAEALRALPPDVAAAAASALPDWVAVQVSQLAPDLREREPMSPGVDIRPQGETQERLFEAVARFLAQVSDQTPLLLILEDLHWASDSTLQLLHYLARSSIAHPLLIVGTLRPEAIPPAHPLATLGRRLEREGLARRLSLSPLSAAAVAELIGQMSGQGGAAAPLAARLHQETEGNPFYLIETIKALFEQGAIRVEGVAWRADYAALSRGRLPLPASVSETIAARVGRLNEAAQDAIQVAAVAGREFDFDLLNATWGKGEEATLAALDDLLRRRLVGEAASGADYAFAHHKIQEVVYEALPRRRRIHLHCRVAEALERLRAVDLDAFSACIAGHYELAGAAAQAADFYWRAADTAWRVYANEDAIAYFSRALALTSEADHARRYPLLLARMRLYDIVGRLEARGKDLAQLVESADALGDGVLCAEIAVARAQYATSLCDYASALTHAEAAVAAAQAAGDQANEALGFLCAGRALWLQGEFETAQVRLAEAQRLARVAQTPQTEASILVQMAGVALHRGDLKRSRALGEQALHLYANYQPGRMRALGMLGNAAHGLCDYLGAISFYEEALSICRQLGVRQFEAVLLCHLGAAWQYLGEAARAAALFEQSLKLSREVGDRLGESKTLICWGSLVCWRGDHASGRRAAEQGLHLAQSIGAQHEMGLALLQLGYALVGLGQIEEAAGAYRQALSIGRKLANRGETRDSLAGLADVALAQGQIEDAAIYVEEILSLIDVNSLASETEWTKVILTCVRVLRVCRDSRAAAILAAAHTRLQAHAAALGDGNLRRSFLENRPDHRALIAAWKAASDPGMTQWLDAA